jgi:hypothetical protein
MDEPTPVDVASDDRRGDGLDDVGCSVSDANEDGVEPISLGLLTKRPANGGVKAAKSNKCAKHAKMHAGMDTEVGSISACSHRGRDGIKSIGRAG